MENKFVMPTVCIADEQDGVARILSKRPLNGMSTTRANVIYHKQSRTVEAIFRRNLPVTIEPSEVVCRKSKGYDKNTHVQAPSNNVYQAGVNDDPFSTAR